MARRISRLLFPSLGLVALGGIALAACQSYEFEEVTPKAFGAVTEDIVITGKMLPPYIMLVVDKSGSMNQPAYSGSTTSKWDDLLGAFSDQQTGFLPKSKEIARFGLALFPASTGEGCHPGPVSVSLNAEADNVDTIIGQLGAVTPEGGTPTALTIEKAAADPALVNEEPGRLRFVMLLTDGLPNCNPSPENQARCDACNANLAVCNDISQNGCLPTFGGFEGECDEYPQKGDACLDENGNAEAIAKLKKNGVETFVIGFGDDFGGDGHRVLNRAAEAGGRAREGETKYFKAGNKEELILALKEIMDGTQKCSFSVDPAPTSRNVFQVVLYDGESDTEETLVRESEWKFLTEQLTSVEILGARCELIRNAPPDRYNIRFKYAASL
ncbi:MAG TPA: hypothetical protein DFS52_11895 [Myxococcales bacterium]|jgi:hypothetical protein|nr:hypothetical protein [Myxococcales bacterium]